METRIVQAEIDGLIVASVYVPNGGAACAAPDRTVGNGGLRAAYDRPTRQRIDPATEEVVSVGDLQPQVIIFDSINVSVAYRYYPQSLV